MRKINLNKVIALLLFVLVIMGSLSLTPVFAIESEYDGIKVHAIHKDPESDWIPCLWAWDMVTGTNAFSTWPGEPMALGSDGWYYITVDLPENCEYGLSISNAGALQSADMLGYTAEEIWIVIDDYNAVRYTEYISIYTEKPNDDLIFDGIKKSDSTEGTDFTEPYTTEPTETETVPNWSLNDTPAAGYHRYYFYMPESWYNEHTTTAGIYWWEGTNYCSKWPGYVANETDTTGVYYYDVPDDVTNIIWNNNVNDFATDSQVVYLSGYQTVNIGSEYYDAGESINYPNGTVDFDGMIYVIDESKTLINDFSGKAMYSGEWYYYYGNGEYGLTPEKSNIYFAERTYNGAPTPVGEDALEESAPVSEKDDTLLADDTAIYFEVPEFWKNYDRIYCHIFERDGDSLANWHSKRELCVQESEDLYHYNISDVGGLQNDKVYGVIFSSDTGYQTCEALLLPDCYGSTLYWNGKNYVNPNDVNKTDTGVSWKNQDKITEASIKQITYTGEVIGEVYAPNESNETLFTDFLGNNLEKARVYSGKDDLDLINGIIKGLELDADRAESIILSKGVNVNWNTDMLSGDKLVLGDSDLDGAVKIKDATAIQKYAANMISLSEKALLAADVNADNKVNVKDATAIQKFLANIDTGLEIGANNVSVGEFSGTLPNIKTRLYFDIPGSWEDYGDVFCHIYDKYGNELSSWQSLEELCAQYEDKTYYFDTTRVGGLDTSVTYYVAFSTDMGYEAEHIKFTGVLPDSPLTLITLKVPEIEEPVIPDDSDNNYDEPELEYTYNDYFDTLASWIKSNGSLTSGGAYKVVLKNSGGDEIGASYVSGAEERIHIYSINDGIRYETSAYFVLYSDDSKTARYSFIHEVGYNCEGKISKSFSGDDTYLPCDDFFNLSTLSETKAKNDTIFYLDSALKNIARQLKSNGAPVSLNDLGFVNY